MIVIGGVSESDYVIGSDSVSEIDRVIVVGGASECVRVIGNDSVSECDWE